MPWNTLVCASHGPAFSWCAPTRHAYPCTPRRTKATFGGVAFRLKKLKEKTAMAVGREKK
jgi:hypothetical protein